MSNTSLAIILLLTLVLTVVVVVSGISSLKQAKAETPGQNQTGDEESPYIGDKELLQADATIIAGILILLTISSIKDQPMLTLYGFIGLVPFALSEMLLIIAGMFGYTMGPYVAGWFLITSRLAAIAGFVILTVVLAVLIKYNVQVRWKEIRERRTWGK